MQFGEAKALNLPEHTVAAWQKFSDEARYIVMAYFFMAHIVMAYIVMANKVRGYIGISCTVMTYRGIWFI